MAVRLENLTATVICRDIRRSVSYNGSTVSRIRGQRSFRTERAGVPTRLRRLLGLLVEPDVPKPHIEQLHLGVDQVLGSHSAPRFLEAFIVFLVEVHEPEDGIQTVFPRRHLVFRNTILKEPVVRGHAAERSHEDLRDEDR